MCSLINKYSGVSVAVRAVTDCVPLCHGVRPLRELRLREKVVLDQSKELTSGRVSRRSVGLWHGSVSVGLGAPLQVRLVHTDVCKVPDFNKYRRADTMESHKNSNEHDRRIYSYVAVFGASVMATVTAKEFVRNALEGMGPNAKTMAEASVEIDISNIPEGKNAVFKWRSKPIFVRHRTAEDIERESKVNIEELRHKQTDLERVQKPEWLIMVGICTHLGCVPIANAGDYHGYYCPCHGSHYDGSGRIRRGPAPENLEIPSYKFLDDKTIVVG